MEKEIFDTITDYIYSVQALVDRINRMYTVKIEGDRTSDAITHLTKRIDRVELEGVKLISMKYNNSVTLELRRLLTNYIISTDILIDRLECKKGDLQFAVNRIEHYEDKLLKELKKEVKQTELVKFIDVWLPLFKYIKITPQLMNIFRKECKEKEFKLINVLELMLKRQNLEG